MLLEFFLPDWRAINIFKIYSLSVFVLVIFRGIKVLICELAQIAQVVSDCKWNVFFSGNVARVLD